MTEEPIGDAERLLPEATTDRRNQAPAGTEHGPDEVSTDGDDAAGEADVRMRRRGGLWMRRTAPPTGSRPIGPPPKEGRPPSGSGS